MAEFIGEFLFAILRSFVAEGVYSLWLTVAAWLDTKLAGRKAKVVVGMFLGLALFFLIPVVLGLSGL